MDVKLTEQNNGGDLTLNNNDLALVYGVENMPYIAMFAGGDFWGNDLLLAEKFRAYLAETERMLLTVALNSQGRVEIENAVKRDLQFLLDIVQGSTLTVQTKITDDNRLEMLITFNGQEINLLWNPQTATLTDTAHIVPICPAPTGLTLSSTAGTITASWTAISGVTYQYAYNSTGAAPTTWSDVSGGGIMISGLSAGTTYYFYLRTKCVGSFSGYLTDTIMTVPTPPLTAGLILSVWSDYGVETTGTDVDKWNDLSGNSNHLYATGLKPLVTDSFFGTKPAISFDPTEYLRTGSLMAGLSGSQGCTVYIVANNPAPVAPYLLISYATTPSSIVVGEFESYMQTPMATPEITLIMKGNAGANAGVLQTTEDTPFVYMFDMDFAKTAAAELKMSQNNDQSTFTLVASYNNTNQFIFAPLQVGGGSYNIAAILMYSVSHTNSEKTSIINYLKTYFSIP